VARTYSHATLEDLAANASVSVVNALSDAEHPCQVLGDLLTMKERFGRVVGLNVAFIGDGTNVAASLALAAAAVGANFTIASPEGYDLPQSLVKQAQELGGKSGASIHLVGQPQDAVSGADVVYTDVWVSMGQENEAEERLRRFREYQVTPGLVQCAGPEAIFMHPLPAHHGEEIEIGMLDHSQSVVFDQAENRLHAQKAVLELIMSSKGE
jgi:ornithine carbamoyltransferase